VNPKSRNAENPAVEEASEYPETPDRRYSIFEMDGIGQILVRCNNDVNVNGIGLASLSARVEYVPHMGVETSEDEEWLWNYCTAVFKCSDQHILFRLHHHVTAVLNMEFAYSTHFQDDRQLSPERISLLSTRVRRLADLMSQLRNLQPGRFLLERDDGQMNILKDLSENEQLDFRADQMVNLVDIADKIGLDDILPVKAAKDVFKGIDYHRTFVWHIVQKRIPASYLPVKGGGHSPSKNVPGSRRRGKRQKNQHRKR